MATLLAGGLFATRVRLRHVLVHSLGEFFGDYESWHHELCLCEWYV